jgi:hypothetical protein
MQSDCIRRRQAGCPVGKTTKRRPSICRTDSWPRAVGTMVTGPEVGACTRLMVLVLVLVLVLVSVLILVPVLMLWKPQLYRKSC